jgi:hypothetical protein
VTGQPVDLETSSQDHDAAIEEELEILRSKVDQLSNEVGSFLLSLLPAINVISDLKRDSLRREVNQQAAEINTLQCLAKVPTPTQKNSGKPGQEVDCIPSVPPTIN